MGLLDLFRKNKQLTVERNKSGQWSYWLGESPYGNDKDYLQWSLENPVLMTVIALRAKLYSQMLITHVNSKGEQIENSPYLKLLKKPNYFQSQQDFLFQQMWFLSATGEDYTYQIRRFNNEAPTKLYNLIPTDTDFNDIEDVDYFFKNKGDETNFGKKKITYNLDGKDWELEIKDIIPFYDLANGLTSDSWLSSPSRVEGVKNVLHNIDENLKAKNINLKMSQKFLASNKSNMDGTPMIQDKDRQDIETKLGAKSILVSNANVEVNHLVSDMKRLYLDEQFSNDALAVLLAFEGNKDILNYSANSGSTYENQEQGIIRFVQNSIQASADNTLNSFSESWGLFEKDECLKASFNHLPVMQVVMKTKIETFEAYQNTLKVALEIGTITPPEAKKMSDKLRIDIGL